MTVMSAPSKKSEKKIPLNGRQDIPLNERLIFALDYPSREEALKMVRSQYDWSVIAQTTEEVLRGALSEARAKNP